ncbi:MAG: hypothetical protein GX152_05065 [Methanosarcina sp.]|nr:hypothetical protein [Methanosarcina sp.]
MRTKKFGLRILILAMLLVSMVFVPASCAKPFTEKITEKAVEEIEYSVPEPEPIITLSTTSKMPYWYLLEADENQQKIFFSYIDNCYVSNEEKKEMKKEMEDIWKRYPDKITEEDYQTLEEISNATSEYLNHKYGNKGIGIQWAGNTHNKMTYSACRKMGVSINYAQTASDYADDPDDWDSGFWQSYNHYYNPVVPTTGYAHVNCANLTNNAKAYYSNSQLTSAYQHLGYATHYMSDLGNPMHTGCEVDQYQNQWVHTSYESYVYNNWDTGQKYGDVVNATNTYYTITNPKQSAENLASSTHPDVDTLYKLVYYNPTTFGSNPDVIAITMYGLREATKYNKGLVNYVRG